MIVIAASLTLSGVSIAITTLNAWTVWRCRKTR